MAMRNEALTVFKIKQSVAHAVAPCKTNFKHHAALDIGGRNKSLANSHAVAAGFRQNDLGI